MSPSSAISAAEWDRWVESSPAGHFQQLQGWSRCKAGQGWREEVILADPTDLSAGGARLLWKPVRGLRIGYIPKGPILAESSSAPLHAFVTKMTATAKRLGLVAVLVQPPDACTVNEDLWVAAGFERRPIAFVAGATALAPLAGGADAIEDRLNRRLRRSVRQARTRGVTTRWGGREDLGDFFNLMAETCRRQQTRPNPSSVEALERLWDELTPRVHLGFAEVDGRPNAGLLLIGCGERITFWKKGWDGASAQRYANALLMVDALQRFANAGYRIADFAGMNRDIARSVLAGQDPENAESHHRDVFNLRLGARPVLLPEARVFVRHRWLRPWVRGLRGLPSVENALMRRLGGF